MGLFSNGLNRFKDGLTEQNTTDALPEVLLPGEDDVYGEGRSYCRACDKYHYADGICGYHDQQVKKIVHKGEKEAGFLHDEEYQEEKRRFWSR